MLKKPYLYWKWKIKNYKKTVNVEFFLLKLFLVKLSWKIKLKTYFCKKLKSIKNEILNKILINI